MTGLLTSPSRCITASGRSSAVDDVPVFQFEWPGRFNLSIIGDHTIFPLDQPSNIMNPLPSRKSSIRAHEVVFIIVCTKHSLNVLFESLFGSKVVAVALKERERGSS